MSYYTYPQAFRCPQIKPYSLGVDMGLVRTPMQGGNMRQRRQYRIMPHVFRLEFIMEAIELGAWQQWINAFAYDYFLLDLESMWSGKAGTITSPHIVRFITDLEVENVVYGWVRVRVSAELSPNQFTLAGGPLEPGDDWIIAGFARSPAVDWIIASAGLADFIVAGSPAWPASTYGRDIDAQRYEAAIIANGGTISEDRVWVVSEFIIAEKAAGNWARTDDYWPLWAENAVQALTSLKQLRLATAVNAPAFVAGRGYVFNGTTNYINTGFIPPTHGVAITGTDQRIAIYELSDHAAGVSAGTTAVTNTNWIHLLARSGTNAIILLNSPTGSFPLSPQTSVGFTAGSRASGGTTVRAFKTGRTLGSFVTTAPGSVLTGQPALFIGARNLAGTPSQFGAKSVGFLCLGAPLSDAQEAAQAANVQTWLDDIAVQAWVDAVIANGGTVSAARRAIVENFINAEKAAGTWALTDDYWPLWGENEPQALTSLKQRRLATAVAAPTFTADRGFTFNGSTQYLNTGHVPLNHAAAMTAADQRLAAYELTEGVPGGYSAGSHQGTTLATNLTTHNVGNMSAQFNAAAINMTLPVATGIGFTAASRAGGSTTINGYRAGIAVTSGTSGAPGAVLSNLPLYIACRNNVGTATNFRGMQSGFVCIGAPLSPTQEAAQYTNVQAWAAAIGAAV